MYSVAFLSLCFSAILSLIHGLQCYSSFSLSLSFVALTLVIHGVRWTDGESFCSLIYSVTNLSYTLLKLRSLPYTFCSSCLYLFVFVVVVNAFVLVLS
jgi:hypothetical protein